MPSETPTIASANVVQFIIALFHQIGIIKTRFDSWKWTIETTYHESKEYYTIDFCFSRGTAKFSDCILVYKDGAALNVEDFKKEMNEIIEKVDKLFN